MVYEKQRYVCTHSMLHFSLVFAFCVVPSPSLDRSLHGPVPELGDLSIRLVVRSIVNWLIGSLVPSFLLLSFIDLSIHHMDGRFPLSPWSQRSPPRHSLGLLGVIE